MRCGGFKGPEGDPRASNCSLRFGVQDSGLRV